MRVAIIGAGISGLSCARELRTQGCSVTVLSSIMKWVVVLSRMTASRVRSIMAPSFLRPCLRGSRRKWLIGARPVWQRLGTASSCILKKARPPRHAHRHRVLSRRPAWAIWRAFWHWVWMCEPVTASTDRGIAPFRQKTMASESTTTRFQCED